MGLGIGRVRPTLSVEAKAIGDRQSAFLFQLLKISIYRVLPVSLFLLSKSHAAGLTQGMTGVEIPALSPFFLFSQKEVKKFLPRNPLWRSRCKKRACSQPLFSRAGHFWYCGSSVVTMDTVHALPLTGTTHYPHASGHKCQRPFICSCRVTAKSFYCSYSSSFSPCQ